MSEYSPNEVRFYLQQQTTNLKRGWFDDGYSYGEKHSIDRAKEIHQQHGVRIRVVRRTRNPKRSERIVWRSWKTVDLRSE